MAEREIQELVVFVGFVVWGKGGKFVWVFFCFFFNVDLNIEVYSQCYQFQWPAIPLPITQVLSLSEVSF